MGHSPSQPTRKFSTGSIPVLSYGEPTPGRRPLNIIPLPTLNSNLEYVVADSPDRTPYKEEIKEESLEVLIEIEKSSNKVNTR